MSAAADPTSRWRDQRVAVIGDVMLDQFLIGHVDRISPEAPVPVVRFAREEYRLGGAANVARNIGTLGGRPLLVGLVGRDEAADRLRTELDAAGLSAEALVADGARPTTRKVRLVTARNQQVARVDYETDADVAAPMREALVAGARAAAAAADAVVVSDYRKGVVDAALLAAVLDGATARRVPVVADPKGPRSEWYQGVTLVTPNHHEAELMTQASIRDADDARRAARALHERTGASVVITWGEHGMWVLDRTARTTVEEHLPAVSREVADVTGAGDTVIAVLALGLAAGAALIDAARLANRAAGIVVGRFGPAAVTPAELTEAGTDPGSP